MLAPNNSKNIQFQKFWLKPFFCCNVRSDAFSSRPRENSLKRLFSLREEEINSLSFTNIQIFTSATQSDYCMTFWMNCCIYNNSLEINNFHCPRSKLCFIFKKQQQQQHVLSITGMLFAADYSLFFLPCWYCLYFKNKVKQVPKKEQKKAAYILSLTW